MEIEEMEKDNDEEECRGRINNGFKFKILSNIKYKFIY